MVKINREAVISIVGNVDGLVKGITRGQRALKRFWQCRRWYC